MIISIFRVFKFAFQNFWRNIWLSVITITILVLTLLSVNILVVLNVLGNTAVRSIEDRVDVTVSLKPGLVPETVSEIRSYLSGMSQVVNVFLIEPEAALIEFQKRHADNSQILNSLTELEENPFGSTLVVRARSTADYPFVLEALENPSYRDFVQDKNFTDHQNIIERINHISERLRRFGIVLAAVFAVIAVLIILNTIRVAIYIYREEIGIMKLVGASNWFVRTPFLLESVIYSVLAVLITMAIVFPILKLIEPQLQAFFEATPVGLVSFFSTNLVVIFGYELLALAVLTVVSSSIAVGRYLKT